MRMAWCYSPVLDAQAFSVCINRRHCQRTYDTIFSLPSCMLAILRVDTEMDTQSSDEGSILCLIMLFILLIADV
jgi:hypothetical protein